MGHFIEYFYIHSCEKKRGKSREKGDKNDKIKKI